MALFTQYIKHEVDCSLLQCYGKQWSRPVFFNTSPCQGFIRADTLSYLCRSIVIVISRSDFDERMDNKRDYLSLSIIIILCHLSKCGFLLAPFLDFRVCQAKLNPDYHLMLSTDFVYNKLISMKRLRIVHSLVWTYGCTVLGLN